MRTKPLYDSILPITKNQKNGWEMRQMAKFPVPSALESSEPHSPWVGDEAVR